MAASLHARGLVVTVGRVTVLDHVDLAVSPGQRVGLVGPNGVGKTTLLRTLAGELAYDEGELVLHPAGATVGLLRQEPERRVGETVRAFVARRTGVGPAAAELEEATAGLAAGAAGAPDRYAEALERWLALGGGDLDVRLAQTWAELGLADALLDQQLTTLSGGEAARAALAGLLLSRYDVLLLDEPTNDLDLDGLDRLERFVTGQGAATVVVSHDRAFLERTITHVVELDEQHRSSAVYAGGWAAFQEERTTARRHAEEAFGDYAGKRAALGERARQERAWAAKGVRRAKAKPDDGDKIRRASRIEASEQLAARARRTERAIQRLDPVDKPWEAWELRFEIAEAARSGATVAELEGAVVERPGFRLGPIDLHIGWGERVAITGPNGSGKTTLLAALLGAVPLAAGRARLGPSVVVGEIDQFRRRLSGAERLLDSFQRESGLTVADSRTLLAKFGLGPAHVLRPDRSLSPGERTRAALALLQAKGVNCLVLDEPTNHLDLPAIEQLEAALAGYRGTLLLVTHDRRLLEHVELTRVLALAGGAVVSDLDRSA